MNEVPAPATFLNISRRCPFYLKGINIINWKKSAGISSFNLHKLLYPSLTDANSFPYPKYAQVEHKSQ